MHTAWAVCRAQGRRAAPVDLLTVASGLGVVLDAGAAPAARPLAGKATRLNIGRPLASLPEAFEYARDDGPPVPSRVRFVAAALGHRSGGLGSALALVVLGMAMAAHAGMHRWRGMATEASTRR